MNMAMITRIRPLAMDSEPIEEAQQAPQHFAQDQQEHRHDGGGREHLADEPNE